MNRRHTRAERKGIPKRNNIRTKHLFCRKLEFKVDAWDDQDIKAVST